MNEELKQKRKLICRYDLTADDFAKISRDKTKPLATRRAAFSLVAQHYRREIKLKYPK